MCVCVGCVARGTLPTHTLKKKKRSAVTTSAGTKKNTQTHCKGVDPGVCTGRRGEGVDRHPGGAIGPPSSPTGARLGSGSTWSATPSPTGALPRSPPRSTRRSCHELVSSYYDTRTHTHTHTHRAATRAHRPAPSTARKAVCAEPRHVGGQPTPALVGARDDHAPMTDKAPEGRRGPGPRGQEGFRPCGTGTHA